ncbi:MAG: ABC transporter permease [Pseudomonadota bacterium]
MRIGLEPRTAPSTLAQLGAPLIAFALMLITGAGLLWLLGRPALATLQVYFLSPLLDPFSRSEVVVKAIPLALIAAGLCVSFRSNVWNIGAAGQYTLGALAASALALSIGDSMNGPLMMALYLGAGLAGGLAWAAIPALLRTRFSTNEILVSLMLTYVATLLLDWAVRGPLRDPQAFGFPQSPSLPDAVILPVLVEGTRLHGGLLVVVPVAIGLWLLMRTSVLGFSLQVLGTAPRAGIFAGFARNRAVWVGLGLSGALAGLAGAIEVSATIGKLQPDISAVYGFTAIIVAFLARLNPAGALIGALVLAVTFIGGENAQIELQLPRNVTNMFQGLLLFFLLAAETLTRYRVVLRRAPRALAPDIDPGGAAPQPQAEAR